MSKGFWIALGSVALLVVSVFVFGNYRSGLQPVETKTAAQPEIELTDAERERLSIAVGTNYNYTNNTDKLDQAIQTLNDGSEPTKAQLNQFIIDEYQKSKLELEKLALQGDYQAQRNLAFGHATDPRVAGADPAQGCAWYLVLYNSDSPEVVKDLDLANIEIYCSSKQLTPSEQTMAESQATTLLKQIYDKDMTIKMSDYLATI